MGHAVTDFDVIVIGAGAAGMMCAAQAGQRGRKVLLLDHAAKVGERIRISGGGRCNFTNRTVTAENYLSQNRHFVRSALSQYTQHDFIALVQRYGIRYHEREHGQLFCDETAQDIVELLKAECDRGQVQWCTPCSVTTVESVSDTPWRFAVQTSQGQFKAASLVVASGGLAAPKIGATPFGYKLAEQFGLAVVPPKPALVPLALDPDVLQGLQPLAGNTLAAITHCGKHAPAFRENVLLTHRGLSGPAILQISSYWQMQDYPDKKGKLPKRSPVEIELLPDVAVADWLEGQRRSRTLLPNLLAEQLPRRFAHEWCNLYGWSKPLAELSNADLAKVVALLQRWPIMPSGTLGYNKAEVTLGGVDTRALSSQTMEAKAVAGLYFIGEVMDVTGWLGGYNFQWAWSSGWVAGQVV